MIGSSERIRFVGIGGGMETGHRVSKEVEIGVGGLRRDWKQLVDLCGVNKIEEMKISIILRVVYILFVRF